MNCVGAIFLLLIFNGLFKPYKSQPTPEYPAKIIDLSSLEIVGCCNPVKTFVIAIGSLILLSESVLLFLRNEFLYRL